MSFQPETSLRVRSHPLLIVRATLGQAACSLSCVRFHMQGAASEKKAGSCSVTFLFLASEKGYGQSLRHLGDFHGAFVKGRNAEIWL